MPPKIVSYLNKLVSQPQVDVINIPWEEKFLYDYKWNVKQWVNQELNGHFWISPDIAVAEDTIVPPYPSGPGRIPIVFPDNLGPFSQLGPYALSVTDITTRSRFAQLGIEVDSNTALIGLTKQVSIMNFAKRPIYLAANTPICYLYYMSKPLLGGKALENALGNSIKITGNEGVDWRRWYGNPRINPRRSLLGLEFFIHPDSRRTVLPGNELMSIDGGEATNHNRTAVDQFLAPLPISDEEMLVIAETKAEIELNSTIHGLCDMATAYGKAEVGAFRIPDFQVNSLLLRGGNTYGRVRTETWGRILQGQIAETLLVKFVDA